MRQTPAFGAGFQADRGPARAEGGEARGEGGPKNKNPEKKPPVSGQEGLIPIPSPKIYG
jgi:hypothetical protein